MTTGRLLSGGKEYQGQLRDLSPRGAWLECSAPHLQGRAVLVLEHAQGQFEVPVEILQAGHEGIALTFNPLELSQLEALACLGNAQPASSEPSAVQVEAPRGLRLDSVADDWEPPASDPQVHEWAPPSGLVPPPEQERPVTAWRKLPTLSPPSTLPAKPPPPAREQSDDPAPTEEAVSNPAVTEEPTRPRPARLDASGQPPERRDGQRFEQSIPISFDNLTSLIKEFTHNISFGGIFTYTRQPHQAGQEVAVTLIHPVHGGRLTLLGRVAHASQAPSADPVSGQPRYGVGVQFRLPPEELKGLLSDFISSHQKPRGPVDEVVQQARQLLELGQESPHHLLGVDEQASVLDIRRAYFALVDRFHPDRYWGKVPAAEQKQLDELFRRLTAAYETLTS